MWTCHYRSSRACPVAFIAFSVLRVLSRPQALFVTPRVQIPTSMAGVRVVGSWVLGFTAWSHVALVIEFGLWHTFCVPCLGSPILRVCSLALASLGHTPYAQRSPWHGMEGSRCERLSVSQFGCCHQPYQGMRSLGLKNPTRYTCFGVNRDMQHSRGGGGRIGGLSPIKGWCCMTRCRHYHREGKVGEGPQASESSSHSSCALLSVAA